MLTWKIHLTALSTFSLFTRADAQAIQNGMPSTCSHLRNQLHNVGMCEPLGHNKLANIVSDMCRSAGIQRYCTNHSLRATSATRLYSAGMDD